ncbi:MAG: preprotein translocase subunit SecE [Lachnospiraceae bacterium]|nr:preprotein translocase subunit SecE [Lachnospiraceae bacterium]
MADNTQTAKVKNSWFKGLKSELRKISWPKWSLVFKQAAAVIVITVILGLIIAGLDKLIQICLSTIM